MTKLLDAAIGAAATEAPAIRHGLSEVRRRIREAPDATAAEDFRWLAEETDQTCARCGVNLQRWEAMSRQTYCQPCDDALHRPQLDEEARAVREREERLARCGVPAEYLAYTAATWKGSLPAEFAQWCNEPAGFWFVYGDPGRGKTHLAVSALERVLTTRAAGAWCLFADAKEALREIRQALPDGDRAAKPLRECSTLVLDDLGAEQGTDFDARVLSEVLRYRHMHRRATIVTCNLSPEALRGLEFMAAVASRITSQLVTHLGGRDRRRKAS